MKERRKRKPRFVAVPPTNPRVQIQPRDAELIKHVYKHRFLRTGQIITLVRPVFRGKYGEDTIKRRLRELFDEDYLRLPQSQRRFFQPGNGNPENVYAIGNRGAEVLEKAFGIPRGKIEWTWKNNKVGEDHIEHTLLIADVMVALELACRESSAVAFIDAEEILSWAPEGTRREPKPFEWRVTTNHLGREWRVPVRPDQVFGLEFPDKGTCAYFFLEADRGTMTVEPTVKAPWKCSIYRKFVGYYATWEQKGHTRRFDIVNFRTLFVVQTNCARKRVESFLEANRNARNGSGFGGFLFTDYETLVSHRNILEAPWRNGKGELASLLD